MEEASVAGESPDRSKQRESSEEPTSGSAGPVPEARTEASERRDPRLAVSREDAKSSASAGSDGAERPRGGVDTATRVLSVRETETATDEAEEAGSAEEEPVEETEAADEAESADEDAQDDEDDKAEVSDASDASDGSEETDTPEKSEKPDTSATTATSEEEGDTGDDATPGDGRLRDAVAAWVATADERAAANARLEAPEADEDTEGAQKDAEAPEEAPEADEKPSDAPAEDARPVDQPTAVFQTRPAKPSVDQPTTMLKLGDVAPARKKSDKDVEDAEGDKADKADKAGEAGKGNKADEPRDVERTSKFVALRHLDDPSTRKPPGAPKAPSESAEPAEPVS
ncbi:hypothetical protein ACFTXB_28740, partial [Streptomyces sp. NPDC057074]